MSRLAKAVAIVVAIVIVAPVSNWVARAVDVVESEPQAAVGLDAAALLEGGDPDRVLARLEEAAACEDAVPMWFQRELGLPAEARDVRASGTTVSYVVDAESAWAFERVKALLAARGWTCVPLGGIEGATFLKEAGACTWALVTCTQVGSATNVVFRCSISGVPA